MRALLGGVAAGVRVNGLVFDIQGHSVHDGPGGRTLVLMSGCPLRCGWCANPEGQQMKPVLLYRQSRCRRTLRCVDACPVGAVTSRDGTPLFDRTACDRCETNRCVESCYAQALAVSGSWYSIDELMSIVRRDREYWGRDGGVTFGGGDPVAQVDFVREAMRRCRDAYVHTAIETSAYTAPDKFIELIEYADWAFIDIKHMDPERHREGTGADNRLIIENIRSIKASGWPGCVVIRVPVIPGFNDSIENIQSTAVFLQGVGIGELNLLPFHRLGESKYRQLGRAYRYEVTSPPAGEWMEELRGVAQRAGVTCHVGSDTPF